MKGTSISLAALAMGLATPAFAQEQAASNTPAAAQEQAGADAGGIGEIVVTAQKRAENVQDVPIAISAFTSEILQERTVGDVSGLSSITPNVTLDASTPFSGSSSVLGATIRGIGSSDFAFNIDPAVGVYLDGVYLGRSIGANQDLLDVERIEVLKGPQGTLFGRNTIGGAISIVTHTPGDEFKAKGDVTIGRYNRFQVRGLVDIPLADGLSSSVAFGMQKRDGYQRRLANPDPGKTEPFTLFPAIGYATGQRQGGDDSWNLRAKLRWDSGGGVVATLTGDYSNSDQDSTANSVLAVTPIPGPFAGVAANNIPGTALDVVTGNSGFLFAGLYNFCIGATPAEIAARNATNLCGPRSSVSGFNTIAGLGSRNVDGNPNNDLLPYDNRWVTTDKDTTFADGNNFSRLKQWGLGLTLDIELSATVSLKSITSYRKVDFEAGVDTDNSPLAIGQVSFGVDQYQLSQELQLTGSAFDNKLQFVLGGYGFKEKGDLRDFVTFGNGLLQIDGPGQVKTEAYAAFGQLDYRVNDLIGLTFGGRYTKESKEYHGAQADLNGFNYKLFNCTDTNPSTGLPSATCATALGFPFPDQPFRYYPGTPDKQNFDNFSFKAGVQLHPTDDLMFYGSFSQGYKTGGWTTRLSNPLPVAPTFGEEKAETWEAGVKSTLIDRRLQLNAAAFTTQYKGIQLNFQQGISPTIQNAGDARIKGFEIEAQGAPADNFTVTASLGYIDAFYTRVLGPAQVAPNPFQLGVQEGSALPKAPHWKINVSPRLELPVGSGKLVMIGDWTHTTGMRNDTEGTVLLLRPTTDIINASIQYKAPGNRWNLTVGGTNLTDQRYLVTGQAQIAGGAIFGTYSRPAEWYARLGFEF